MPHSSTSREAQSHARRLAEENAALRREAADILSRSRWYRDDCLRELLLARRWYPAPARSDER
jgi:hypothetical protein